MTTEDLFKELRNIRLDMARMLGTRLDREAMADRLGITQRTLYNRIQAGSVPRPDPDGKWRLSEVMAWEENQTKEPA